MEMHRRSPWLLTDISSSDCSPCKPACSITQRSWALPPRSDDEFFETACCHAALVGLAGRAGSGVSAAQGRAAADRAMERLRRAVATGYRNADGIRIERALDPLRGRDEFELLMMDLAMPGEPFAAAP
jgi:hypothetical protein